MVNACMKNVDVNGDDLLNERMYYWVICSCIHKCQVGYLYPMKTIRIPCIHRRRLEYFVFNEATIMKLFCIKRRRLVPHAYRVGYRAHYIHSISVILDYVLGDYMHLWTWWSMYFVKFGDHGKMWKCTCYIIMLVCLMLNNDVEFIMNDLIKFH